MVKRFTYLLPLLLVTFALKSAGQNLNEYQVKAVFIYNFTTFVEWPATAFSGPKDPFVIGVLGENVFEGSLEQAVEGESVKGHPITIRYFNTLASISHCHILFIGKDSPFDIELYAKKVSTQPVLTVSDDPDFMKQGGLIYLFNENNKIRLQINEDRANKAGLVISSKLLRLATLYKKQ